MKMMIDSTTMVSISDANQNFSRVARPVDERGSAVIMKNNMPRYLVVDIRQLEKMTTADGADAARIAAQLMQQNQEAYEGPAK